MVTKLKSDTTVSLMFFQHCETFCVLELYKSTATWSLLCVYIYISATSKIVICKLIKVPWNVVIGVMFSTHILKLSTMVVWRIIYNLAVHSYWSLFVLFFFLVGGGETVIFFLLRDYYLFWISSIIHVYVDDLFKWWK